MITVFEFAAIVLIIIGLLNERYIIVWERRQARKIKNFIKELRKCL